MNPSSAPAADTRFISWIVAHALTMGKPIPAPGRPAVPRSSPRPEPARILRFATLPGLPGPLPGPTLDGWLVQYAYSLQSETGRRFPDRRVFDGPMSDNDEEMDALGGVDARGVRAIAQAP
jgi:hypothetical protein